MYVHERYHADTNLPRLLGWWGNRGETRFQMNNQFDPIQGANVYRMSNPCVLAVVALHASLSIFEQTSMDKLNQKTRLLTGYLELLLIKEFQLDKPHAPFVIMTPADLKQRGCQLSLKFKRNIKEIFGRLTNAGIVCDERKPHGIRIAPVPLYNSYRDVWIFVQVLKQAVKE
jgi:kynureninase